MDAHNQARSFVFLITFCSVFSYALAGWGRSSSPLKVLLYRTPERWVPAPMVDPLSSEFQSLLFQSIWQLLAPYQKPGRELVVPLPFTGVASCLRAWSKVKGWGLLEGSNHIHWPEEKLGAIKPNLEQVYYFLTNESNGARSPCRFSDGSGSMSVSGFGSFRLSSSEVVMNPPKGTHQISLTRRLDDQVFTLETHEAEEARFLYASQGKFDVTYNSFSHFHEASLQKKLEKNFENKLWPGSHVEFFVLPNWDIKLDPGLRKNLISAIDSEVFVKLAYGKLATSIWPVSEKKSADHNQKSNESIKSRTIKLISTSQAEGVRKMELIRYFVSRFSWATELISVEPALYYKSIEKVRPDIISVRVSGYFSACSLLPYAKRLGLGWDSVTGALPESRCNDLSEKTLREFDSTSAWIPFIRWNHQSFVRKGLIKEDKWMADSTSVGGLRALLMGVQR